MQQINSAFEETETDTKMTIVKERKPRLQLNDKNGLLNPSLQPEDDRTIAEIAQNYEASLFLLFNKRAAEQFEIRWVWVLCASGLFSLCHPKVVERGKRHTQLLDQIFCLLKDGTK
jgi:hypothetical protein